MKQEAKNNLLSGWDTIKLVDFGSTYSGLTGKTKDDFGSGKPYIPYLNIFFNSIIIDGEFDFVKINENENQSIVENGDLFFTTSSETPEEVGMCSVYLGNEPELYLNSFCFGFRPFNKNKISTLYLSHLFRSNFGRKIIYKLAQGATRYNLSKNSLLREEFLIPSYSEQKSIAKFLNKWDDVISKTQVYITQIQKRNTWLLQHLLSGQKRFPEFIESNEKVKTKVGVLPLDWKLMHVTDIVNRIKNSFSPEPLEFYKEIGIRSHTKGIFYKEPVTGESLGNKSVFWIQPDCFIVNIVFAWEHAIAKTTKNEMGMIASHRFPMYKPKSKILDLDYLLYFFKTERGKHLLGLASPGGAGRNKTLGQEEFMKLQIPIPDIKEQKKIASVLCAADNELQILNEKLEKLKDQKRGLMQQLLTGKKRLNIK